MKAARSENDKLMDEFVKPRKNLAWIILAVSLLITVLYTRNSEKNLEIQAYKEFSYESYKIKDAIYTRLEANAQVLWNGAAFFESSDSVSREEWRIFITYQQLPKALPGIQGVGYAQLIGAEELSNHELFMRNQGFTKYKVNPTSQSDVYSPIVYLEPSNGPNQNAFGYNMFSDSVRNKAMMSACDNYNASLSGKVFLVQETNTNLQAGTIMYVPVYTLGKPTNSISQRREALKGWVFSPYRMNDLMRGILGSNKIENLNTIQLKIYDDSQVTAKALLYDSKQKDNPDAHKSNEFKLVIPVYFNGTQWTLVFVKPLAYRSYYFSEGIILIFIGGVILSFIISLLIKALQNSRFHLKNSKILSDKLRQSLTKQLALFNAIPDSVIVSDKKTGMIEDINQKAVNQYGFTFIELHMKNNTDLICNKDEYIGNDLFRNLGRSYHKRKDETLFPVETTSSQFILNNEVKTVSVNRDITERLKTEDELLIKNEVFENSIAGQSVSDSNGNLIYVNQSLATMWGYKSPDEVIGQHLSSLFSNKSEFEIFFASLLKKHTWQGEFTGLQSDGNTLVIRTFVSTIKNELGSIIGFQATNLDVTERKKAEDTLRESEEKWRSLVNNSPDYIALHDEQGNYLYLNRFAQGFTQQDIEGQNVYKFLSEETSHIFKTNFDNCVKDWKPVKFEHIALGDNGKMRIYEESLVPIKTRNGNTNILAVAKDITERKTAHDLIQAALNEKEILLREVHHRVKNNLQVVSSLLNLQANNTANKMLRDALDQSRNRIRSIALVHEKLYKSGNFAEINLKDYTQSLLAELFRVYVPDADKIKFKMEIPNINLPLIYAIPCGLILNEIISNSLKYAFPKQSIDNEIFVSLKKLPNHLLQLCVGDNGIGLPDDYQLDNSSSLGLYLIHILATEQLDGKLEIENNKGTIFTITFNPFPK